MDSSDAYAPAVHTPLAGTPASSPFLRPGDSPEPGERDPFGDPPPARRAVGNLRRRVSGAIAALAALIAKFFAAVKGLLLLLPKVKLLTTAGTALVSVAAYSLWFGWTFAIGFVVLLFVHEMGHVIQLRREGIKATAPMFVPFMGAFISAKSLGDNALAVARVGLAGPVLGTLGAGVCLAVGELTNSDLLRALAYIGFFLNLFNLLPVVPLDGGRAMAAMAPWMWFIGLGALVALLFIVPNPILLIIVLLGAWETYRRWQARKTRSLQQAAYYRVSPRNRLLVGAVYVGLIVLLALGMDASHVLSTGGHSFAHL
ncbi:MAG TPA: site-2 protease family protein [Solirubrobacteraceae bacterium]|nr:site-2 protease family protein [Solirubrobacteraceae bacterium]